MSWKGEFSELLQFLDDSTATFPSRLFNNAPEKDSTPVRKIAFAFENMAEQLKRRLVPSTQALARALVYKFNGPHHRQGYWMNYKNLSRALRRYNEDDLLQRVSDVHKKATASGVGFYMPSNDVILYLGSAYLKRLFRLQQIRDLCIRTAHVIMGQLELGHWEKFSLFIVALCADINNGIAKQAGDMESVYNGISSFLMSLDKRFPSSLSDLSIFASLRGRTSGQKTVDTARVMRLLQLSDEQLEIVRTKDQMARFRDEMLSSMDSKNDEVDLGTTVERGVEMEAESENMDLELRKVSSTDSGVGVDSEASTSLNVFEETAEETTERVLTAEEMGKKQKKKLRKRKKRNKLMLHNQSETVSSSTSMNPESQFDASPMVEDGLNKKARKDANCDEQTNDSSSILFTSTPNSTRKKKKKKSQKAFSTNFDLSGEMISPSLSLREALFRTPKKKLKKKHGLGSGAVDDVVPRKRKSMECTMNSSIAAVPSKKKKKRHSVGI